MRGRIEKERGGMRNRVLRERERERESESERDRESKRKERW